MTATVMSGNEPAKLIRRKIKEEIEEIGNFKPVLATVLVGDNPASKTYLKNKHAACSEVGIESRNIELPASTSQTELEMFLNGLNCDPLITGVLLQLPLPKGLNEANAINKISPKKDVDGLHPCNVGLLVQRTEGIVPCTPKGVIVLLRYYRIPIAGRHVVIVNRSKLVGRPLSQLFLNSDATVTVCHSKTTDLPRVCREADILITGIGHRSQFSVGEDMVKQGAVVVDVGTSIVNGKLMGDVDFDNVSRVASHISPVPGGVGPMTISMLLYNTILTASNLQERNLSFDLETLQPS